MRTMDENPVRGRWEADEKLGCWCEKKRFLTNFSGTVFASAARQ